MEMTAIYIYGAIGAIFCLVIGTLIGYAICEGQQLQINALKGHLKVYDDEGNDLLKLHEQQRKADEAIIHELCIEHEKAQIGAYDPKLNQKAKNLYVKGVRAGAKKGRAQMQKLMQKSIDNQAATINEYVKGLAASRIRYGQFVLATRNVLDDKIALPGVRRALRKAISVEVTRMRTASGAMEAV